MKRSRAAIHAIVIGAALTFTAPASAQSAAQGKRFVAAQKLYDEGAYTPALAEFKALAAETGSPNAELYVARCLRELGKLPEAYEALTLAVRDATARAASEPKYATTRNTAAADLAQLEPRIGKVLVAVASTPPGLAVTLGGAPLSADRLGSPVAAIPGEVVITLKAPGFKDVERRVSLKGGQLVTLTVAMEPVSAAGAPAPVTPVKPAPVPVPPERPASPGLGPVRGAGIAVLVVGAGGMATFAVTGLMANHRYSTVQAACGNMRCTDPKYAGDIAGGKQLDLIADIGLGVGIAGLVAGTLMVALGKASHDGAAPKANVGAWIGPGGGGLSLKGAF